MSKKELIAILAEAPDDCLVVVCDKQPSGNFDNSGIEVQDAEWSPGAEDDPHDLGVCYLAIQGLDPESGVDQSGGPVEVAASNVAIGTDFMYNGDQLCRVTMNDQILIVMKGLDCIIATDLDGNVRLVMVDNKVRPL